MAITDLTMTKITEYMNSPEFQEAIAEITQRMRMNQMVFRFNTDDPLVAKLSGNITLAFADWCEAHNISINNQFTATMPDEATKTLFILRWS